MSQMSRLLPVAAIAGLTGCEFIESLVEPFQGLVEPLVVVGAVVDVQFPEGVEIALEGTTLQAGTAFVGALSDVASVADGVGISGGAVSLDGVASVDRGDGTYTIAPGACEYAVGETWSLDVDLDGAAATAWVTLPPAAVWPAPKGHRAGSDLVVDLGDQAFDMLFVAVADAETGEITWTNQPATAQDMLVALHTSGPLVVTVPGDVAFPTDGAYWIGVGAAVRTQAEDLVGMNTAMSAILAGRMVVHPLPVYP